MREKNTLPASHSMEQLRFGTKELANTVNGLCENALEDAKSQLHPLLQNIELDRLGRRAEFLQAFKNALEQGISRKLHFWQPGIQAVFRFDESLADMGNDWDGSIHLLVKVPRLSDALKELGQRLDQSLVKCLKQWSWSRFRNSETILELQQITLNELRHGIGYGAMFYAVYTAPVKVWPPEQKAG
jgi:hypothetical protein